jgi:pimeloyl-ACP methyl ester carboxylesterase
MHPPLEPAVPTFNSDGVEIAYSDQGSPDAAGDPILLLHGFASSAKTNWVEPGWVSFLVREGFRVVAYDARGHGMSGKPHRPEDYAQPHMPEDARRLLDHLSIARAHVMGYSMGARMTAFLTLRHPERVRSAIFGGLGINMVRGLSGTQEIAAGLEAASTAEIADPVARTFRAFAEQTGGDLKALSACMRSARAALTAEMVVQIRCPVLVVVGTADSIGGSARELADLIPGAKAVAVERRDHMRTVGDRAYKEAVLAFLKPQTS